MEIHYFVEDWEGQNDFHYLNDYVTDNKNFSVFMASPAVKAKFKYPTGDLTPNEIQDDRSDSEKIQDILRIWA